MAKPPSQTLVARKDKLKTMVQAFKLEDDELRSCLKMIENNSGLLLGFKVGLKSILAMKSYEKGTDLTEIVNYMNQLADCRSLMREDEKETLGNFLAIVPFCKESYNLYKSLLQFENMTIEEAIGPELDLKAHSLLSKTLKMIRSSWWNFPNSSFRFGMQLFEDGVVEEAFQNLQGFVDKDGSYLDRSYVFESTVGILYNTARVPDLRQGFRDLKLVVPDSRQGFQDLKLVDLLVKFLKYQDHRALTMRILLTLSCIIDDSQADLLTSHSSVFELIIALTRKAWESQSHSAVLSKTSGSSIRFSCIELLEGMAGLSRNDDIKRLLVEKGVLDVIRNVLKDGNVQEKLVAARLLRQLSFHPENDPTLTKDEELMRTVKELSESSNKDLSKNCQGILMSVEMHKLQKEGKEKRRERNLSDRGHVMISYNWDHQEKLIKVRNELKRHGYQVWMDIDCMSGSTLDAMARAVEQSAVVLVCMSERYKESLNCRQEGEYAHTQRKQIVPLLMQDGYRPDGWLGILVASKLYFNFSGKVPFEKALGDLVKELGERGKVGAGSQVDTVDGHDPKSSKTTVKLDVEKWLIENKLDKYPGLHKLTSEHVAFLKKLSSRAPEFYHQCVKEILCTCTLKPEDLTKMAELTQAIERS